MVPTGLQRRELPGVPLWEHRGMDKTFPLFLHSVRPRSLPVFPVEREWHLVATSPPHQPQTGFSAAGLDAGGSGNDGEALRVPRS